MEAIADTFGLFAAACFRQALVDTVVTVEVTRASGLSGPPSGSRTEGMTNFLRVVPWSRVDSVLNAHGCPITWRLDAPQVRLLSGADSRLDRHRGDRQNAYARRNGGADPAGHL